MSCKKVSFRVISSIFAYETVKIVSIRSIKIGLLCRLIQLGILAYVIGYVIVFKKGYQLSEPGVSGAVSKVKGVSFVNNSENPIWDVADFVVPPIERDALFITTNALITRKQTQGRCAEDADINGANCTKDSDCIAFDPIALGDGVRTGKCINNSTCEVYAWCPVEHSEPDNSTEQIKLTYVQNFTVFVKNNVEFLRTKVSTSNIPPSYNNKQLQACRYHEVYDTECPIFQIDTILRIAGVKYEDIASHGCVIAFLIKWDCNLDRNVKYCFPTYSFIRLDTEDSSISSGWNFRYAKYYYMNDTQHRDLIKAYGIRIIISVSSKGGKFDIMQLTTNLGSGLALLVIATIVCDLIVLYILKNREKYIDAKYHKIAGEDPFQKFDSESNSLSKR